MPARPRWRPSKFSPADSSCHFYFLRELIMGFRLGGSQSSVRSTFPSSRQVTVLLILLKLSVTKYSFQRFVNSRSVVGGSSVKLLNAGSPLMFSADTSKTFLSKR